MSWPEQSAAVAPRPGTPLYEFLVLELTEALFSDPPAGDRLPTEAELCERFSVSRTTVRRALGGNAGLGVRRRNWCAGLVRAGVRPASRHSAQHAAL